MILLVASRTDKAAMNIADQLLSNHGFPAYPERASNPEGKIAQLWR